ncbi:MAG: hypothetical protein J6D10_07250, partial [Clostridia bacterium]|nr:hypothetical protein [Clostridia bacterium]
MMQNNPNQEPNETNEDISLYYPDGDAEHIARDDHDEAFLNETIRKKKKIRRRNGRLKRSQILMIAAIFVIYALVLVVAAWMIFYKPATPPVEEMPFDTTPMIPVTSPENVPVSSDPNNPPLTGNTDPETPTTETPPGRAAAGGTETGGKIRHQGRRI